MSNTATSHVLNAPQTATKLIRPHKKRGRKGNKIDSAFKAIPHRPVEFDKYAKDCGITINVLRQVKRHDNYKESGKVYIRKNKQTQKVMIWREPPTTEA